MLDDIKLGMLLRARQTEWYVRVQRDDYATGHNQSIAEDTICEVIKFDSDRMFTVWIPTLNCYARFVIKAYFK